MESGARPEPTLEVAAEQLLVWRIDDTHGFDSAWVRLDGGRLVAAGHAVGQRPGPFWTEYELETDDELVTARVRMRARWSGGAATLDLVRDPATGWTVNGEPRPDLAAALDCDLAESPLTNTMPVLRHDLLRRAGDERLLMAFIQVPELRVVPSHQRYTHVRAGDPRGAVVKYRSDGFESDIVFDERGFVLDYPQLGRRVE